jgi:hypothetical protein
MRLATSKSNETTKRSKIRGGANKKRRKKDKQKEDRKAGYDTHNMALLAALVARFGLGLHRAVARDVALQAAYTHINLYSQTRRKKRERTHSCS